MVGVAVCKWLLSNEDSQKHEKCCPHCSKRAEDSPEPYSQALACFSPMVCKKLRIWSWLQSCPGFLQSSAGWAEESRQDRAQVQD